MPLVADTTREVFLEHVVEDAAAEQRVVVEYEDERVLRRFNFSCFPGTGMRKFAAGKLLRAKPSRLSCPQPSLYIFKPEEC